jgi:two-component system osmolarity sensor histidine kinase EnvZ
MVNPLRHPWLFIKKFLPKSLFGRSLIILLTPLLLLQMILGYIFFDRHTETILRLLSDTIAGDITLVVDWVERDPNYNRVKQLSLNNLHLDIALDRQKKLDKHGPEKDTWLYGFMGEALDHQLQRPYHLKMNSDFIYIDVQSDKGVLHVKTSRKRLFSRTTPLVLIWTTFSAVLLFAVASLFMRNQIRPIRSLANAAERFGKGDDIADFSPEGATEVRKAGYAFLMMRDRLKRLLSDRMQMLAGVSHDLRTPLTRMKLQLAIMPKTPEVESLNDDIETLQEMIEGYLLFARGSANEEIKNLNLTTLIDKLCRKHMNDRAKITLNLENEVFLKIKPNLFNRILTNIMVNSIKYGTQLDITLHKKLHHVEVIFDDNGPGIPDTEKENVLKPFYRLDDSRNTDTGGVGLGLSIVQDGVKSHGGRIYLKNSPLGGLRVLLRFPL